MNEKLLDPVYIDAFNLDDAWFQCVSKILDHGHRYKITKGSFEGEEERLGFDYALIRVRNPGREPIIPIMPEGSGIPPPTDMDYVNNTYLPYLMTDQKAEGEDYTYGERIHNPKARLKEYLDIEKIKEKTGVCLDKLKEEQIKELYPHTIDVKKEGKEIILSKEIPFKVNPFQQVIKDYKEKGFGTNQETMEIGMPPDIILKDPPCLRLIDTRIRYGKLHFIIYFRSWDLWGGFPSNLAGLQLVKKYMADEIGVEDGEIIASSKGLHLYKYVWELAEARAHKKINFKKYEELSKVKG